MSAKPLGKMPPNGLARAEWIRRDAEMIRRSDPELCEHMLESAARIEGCVLTALPLFGDQHREAFPDGRTTLGAQHGHTPWLEE